MQQGARRRHFPGLWLVTLQQGQHIGDRAWRPCCLRQCGTGDAQSDTGREPVSPPSKVACVHHPPFLRFEGLAGSAGAKAALERMIMSCRGAVRRLLPGVQATQSCPWTSISLISAVWPWPSGGG